MTPSTTQPLKIVNIFDRNLTNNPSFELSFRSFVQVKVAELLKALMNFSAHLWTWTPISRSLRVWTWFRLTAIRFPWLAMPAMKRPSSAAAEGAKKKPAASGSIRETVDAIQDWTEQRGEDNRRPKSSTRCWAMDRYLTISVEFSEVRYTLLPIK